MDFYEVLDGTPTVSPRALPILRYVATSVMWL